MDVAGPLTVSALLAHLKIDPRRVAVEHNLLVVKRGAYDMTTIREGDEIEIVNFVGGGSATIGTSGHRDIWATMSRSLSTTRCFDDPISMSRCPDAPMSRWCYV